MIPEYLKDKKKVTLYLAVLTSKEDPETGKPVSSKSVENIENDLMQHNFGAYTSMGCSVNVTNAIRRAVKEASSLGGRNSWLSIPFILMEFTFDMKWLRKNINLEDVFSEASNGDIIIDFKELDNEIEKAVKKQSNFWNYVPDGIYDKLHNPVYEICCSMKTLEDVEVTEDASGVKHFNRFIVREMSVFDIYEDND